MNLHTVQIQVKLVSRIVKCGGDMVPALACNIVSQVHTVRRKFARVQSHRVRRIRPIQRHPELIAN